MRSSSSPLCHVTVASIPLVLNGVRAMFVVLIAMALVTGASNAQNANNPVRDASAIALLQNSVTAMGGTTSWSAVQDWVVNGTTSNNGNAQTFSWTGAGSEFRYEV